MQSATTELESNLRPDATGLAPYFSKEFEVLCQYYDLEDCAQSQIPSNSKLMEMLPVLADRPTKHLRSFLNARSHDHFSKLVAYSGRHQRSNLNLSALQGTLPAQIVKKW